MEFLILYFNMPFLGNKVVSLRRNRNEDRKTASDWQENNSTIKYYKK